MSDTPKHFEIEVGWDIQMMANVIGILLQRAGNEATFVQADFDRIDKAKCRLYGKYDETDTLQVLRAVVYGYEAKELPASKPSTPEAEAAVQKFIGMINRGQGPKGGDA